MQSRLSLVAKLAALAGLALAAMGTAHARDVFWSVGVHAAPGVHVDVGNHRPVVVHPAPIIVQPAPVFVQPAPVFVQPRIVPHVVYTQPQVVYPGPIYSTGSHGHGFRHGHGHRFDGHGHRGHHGHHGHGHRGRHH